MNSNNLPHQPDADKDRLPCLICGKPALVEPMRVSPDNRLLNARECLIAFCPKCERYHPSKVRKIKKAVAAKFLELRQQMRKENHAKWN